MAHAHDSVAKLLSDMRSDLEQETSGELVDFQSKYGSTIESIGASGVMTELFRTVEGSALPDYLSALAFAWRDLPFPAWRTILRGISDSTQAVYQFVWFASPYLRLDVLGMIRADPEVDEAAKNFIAMQFPRGAPAPAGDLERDILVSSGVDPVALWRRLAAEGAPMKVDPSVLD